MVSDQQPNTSCPPDPLTTRFRLLGIFPLTFFLLQAVHYWQIDQLGHLLWMCNVGNLLLALGLFLDQPVMIRVAGIWSIPGLLVWWRYVFTEWFTYATLDWFAVATGTLAHIGGLTVGLLSLWRVRVDRLAWLYAFVWYLAIQFISRLITPADLNVNLSHRIHESWQGRFDSYWKFWVILTIVGAAILWLLGLVLKRIWPCRPIGQQQLP